MAWLWKIIKWLMGSTDNEVEIPIVVEEPPKPVEKTRREKLYDISYSLLGIDVSPKDLAPDVISCAESLSNVLIKAGMPDLHHPLLGTHELNGWLHDHLEEVVEPLPGDIIMSATGTGNGLIRGHCGVVGKHSIMSNNSNTGKWDAHWEMPKWIAYYEKYGGIPTHFYRWL